MNLDDIRRIVKMFEQGMTNRQVLQSYHGRRLRLTNADLEEFLKMKERGLLEMKMKNKITIDRLRKLVAEEYQKINEDIDHEGAAAVTASASKLLKAIGDFQEKATEKANAALGQVLPGMREVLENMVNTPASYVDTPKKVPQKVSFKPGGNSGNGLV